jgi:hypothetical protein
LAGNPSGATYLPVDWCFSELVFISKLTQLLPFVLKY